MLDIKKLIAILLFGVALSSHAGFYSNTAHSRANCYGFNETVTWNALENHWWHVHGVHFNNYNKGLDHHVNDPMRYTWRSIAYHVGEWEGKFADNWHVQGSHYYLLNGREIYDNFTDSFDCRFYDGWWDSQH